MTTHTIYPDEKQQQTNNASTKVYSKRLQYALTYAECRHWYIFPAVIGTKKSHKSAEFSNECRWGATNNPDEIIKDFTNPKFKNCNIGLPTGKSNNIWVLDVDTGDGHDVDGIASLAKLEAEYGTLPATLQATSPSGGRHFFFNIRKTVTSTIAHLK